MKDIAKQIIDYELEKKKDATKSNIQRSCVLIKPAEKDIVDGKEVVTEIAKDVDVQNEIKKRIHAEGLSIEKEGFIRFDTPHLRVHYSKLLHEPFFPKVQEYMTSDDVYFMEVVGEDAIARTRKITGATKNPEKGTIRYDIPAMKGISVKVTENIMHSSDSVESAEKELANCLDLLEKTQNKKTETIVK